MKKFDSKEGFYMFGITKDEFGYPAGYARKKKYNHVFSATSIKNSTSGSIKDNSAVVTSLE